MFYFYQYHQDHEKHKNQKAFNDIWDSNLFHSANAHIY